MIRHDDMERFGDQQATVVFQSSFALQIGDFPDEDLRIENHPVADYTPLARMENPGRDEMEDDLFISHNQGVSGIVPPLITDHVIRELRQDIDYFPFTFVAPLGADYYDVRHAVSLSISVASGWQLLSI
jgi:hypothetical protein